MVREQGYETWHEPAQWEGPFMEGVVTTKCGKVLYGPLRSEGPNYDGSAALWPADGESFCPDCRD